MKLPRDDHQLDAFLRQAHAQALRQVSARTHAQLAVRRSAATSRRTRLARHPGRMLASACAVGVLALGLSGRLPLPSSPPPATAPVAAGAAESAGDSAYAVYDEAPELYLWLASDEATLALDTIALE